MDTEINKKSSFGLGLLNNYLSDEDDSGDGHNQTTELERTEVKDKSFPVTNERLPLPTIILKNNITDINEHMDKAASHDFRIRSFPHQRGNWATYVYIPYNLSSIYHMFCDAVLKETEHLVLKAIPDPHISLTRTFVLLHHWIDGFVKSIEQQLMNTYSFYLSFEKVSAYTNEEKTRTFIGLDVAAGFIELTRSVKLIDDCLKDFNREVFYEDPSFHMSIAWCLGDKKKDLELIIPTIDEHLYHFRSNYPELFNIKVNNYICRTGNKTYCFKLK